MAGWLLLVIIGSQTFAIAVDTREECDALGQANAAYAKVIIYLTGQNPFFVL